MTHTIEAWVIYASERLHRAREIERDESRRIPAVANLHLQEVCPRCRGNGCEACHGRGVIEVSL